MALAYPPTVRRVRENSKLKYEVLNIKCIMWVIHVVVVYWNANQTDETATTVYISTTTAANTSNTPGESCEHCGDLQSTS